MSSFRSPQVLVVGAGPAGLVTAIACALRGLEVVVLERRESLPIDKACGEGLMPDAVERLIGLGVEPKGCRLKGIRYTDRHHDVVGAFPDLAGADDGSAVNESRVVPRRFGLGVRRTELSSALYRRALDLGVEVLLGEELSQICKHGDVGPTRFVVKSSRCTWQPTVVVGADGLHSLVRRGAGLEVSRSLGRRRTTRVGVRRHFQRPRPLGAQTSGTEGLVEVFWERGVEAYLTPVGEEVFGLSFLFEPRPGRGATGTIADIRGGPIFDRLLGRFPELQRRVEGCLPVSRVLGAGPMRQTARCMAVGNLALVGDAAGYVDALTGEGLAIAFAEAELLAERIEQASHFGKQLGPMALALGHYQHAAKRHRRVPEAITRGALFLSRYPWLRRRFLRALERQPAAFERLLALHTRAAPDRAVVRLAAEVCWRLVRG